LRAEAKQAAMTWFRICPFRRDDVHDALTRLTKVCTVDLSEKQLEALTTYLDTGQGENPLADVKMPEVTDEQLPALLANVPSPWDRQVVLLYGGKYQQAMLLTTQLVAEGSMELWGDRPLLQGPGRAHGPGQPVPRVHEDRPGAESPGDVSVRTMISTGTRRRLVGGRWG
jgi:hypothetical protein